MMAEMNGEVENAGECGRTVAGCLLWCYSVAAGAGLGPVCGAASGVWLWPGAVS